MTSPQAPVVTVILSAVACACRTVLLTASRTTARVCPANLPMLNEVPAEVVGHIRRDLRLPEGTMPICASTRTAERHRNLVRVRGEVEYDPAGARKVAADAIEEAARRKNDPAPLKIQSGKNAGKHPSVASLYPAMAETDAQHLATRP